MKPNHNTITEVVKALATELNLKDLSGYRPAGDLDVTIRRARVVNTGWPPVQLRVDICIGEPWYAFEFELASVSVVEEECSYRGALAGCHDLGCPLHGRL